MRVEVVGESPDFAYPGDAGFDLVAQNERIEVIYPGERKLIPTGLRMAIPDGHALLVCPRSGLAANYGITVANAPGIVDSSFRGEIKVILHNLDEHKPFTVEKGMRIAQGVLIATVPVEFVEVKELGNSERGEAGFGSSG